MSAVARVHRAAFDQALPWLAGRHTPQEDQWFFQERVFKECDVWGAFRENELVGMLAQADVTRAEKEKTAGEVVGAISRAPGGPRVARPDDGGSS